MGDMADDLEEALGRMEDAQPFGDEDCEDEETEMPWSNENYEKDERDVD